MTTTAAIEAERPLADGGKRVRYLFTRTESGAQWVSGWRYLEAGADALAVGAALAPTAELTQRQFEREDAWEFTIDGGDLDLYKGGSPDFNTLDDLRTFFFRRLFNLMREDGSPDRDEQGRVCRAMALPGSYMNKPSSPTIVTYVNDPAWNNPTVNDATSRISSAGTALSQLDHGEAELAEDF